MIEFLKEILSNQGARAKIIPLSRLQDIKQDIYNLKASGILNDFQKYILSNIYLFDIPNTNFKIRSILILALPSPFLAKITFSWKGQKIPLALPASYLNEVTGPPELEHYLNEFLNPQGYFFKYAPRLPRKLLAVRSGLGLYGRNNICYVKGMGSFLFLATYFTNISCTENEWHEMGHMKLCRTCTACIQNCPTSAITSDRFLIDNERCLTYLNESGSDRDFPPWLNPSAHHTIYGCLRCQEICPMNKDHLNNIVAPTEFTEEETQFLLKGKPFEILPDTLKQKIEAIDMKGYLGALPRNLKVLFEFKTINIQTV